jgi:altronate hydrolase
MKPALLIDPWDNLAVALRSLAPGETVDLDGMTYPISEAIPPKQKFTLAPMAPGERARMYGVTVGVVTAVIPAGGLVTTANLKHDADGFSGTRTREHQWSPPSVERWSGRTFDGFHRSDGKVGTANHWLVIPMVFCETRNVNAIRTAFERALGYERTTHYQRLADRLVAAYQGGADAKALLELPLESLDEVAPVRLFPNVDGIQFLNHTMGCGGTRDDAESLCGLLASYITHPNVAGATVLSLGCENAQLEILESAIRHRSPSFDKPLLTFRQQAYPRRTDPARFRDQGDLPRSDRGERSEAPSRLARSPQYRGRMWRQRRILRHFREPRRRCPLRPTGGSRRKDSSRRVPRTLRRGAGAGRPMRQ